MADIKTGGGSNVGRDVETGNDYVGRDKFNVGDGAHATGSGNSVNIGTGYSPDVSEREILQRLSRQQEDLAHQQEKMFIALVGDRLYPNTNPGLVAVVEETRDKISSLVAANAAQSMRLDTADKERDLLAKNQQSLIDTQAKYQTENEGKVGGIVKKLDGVASRQTMMMVLLLLLMLVVIAQGAYSIFG